MPFLRASASLLAAAFVAPSVDTEAIAIARRIAAVQSRLPWFGPPDAEGLVDVPYAHEERTTRTRPRKKGSALTDWTSIGFERIPLGWGSEIRCLEYDGRAPCPAEWTEELKRQSSRRDSYTAESKNAVLDARAARRTRRRQFWESFPDSMRITILGPHRLRVQPVTPNQSFEGELTYDPETFEITGLNTKHFAVTLAKLIDGHWLPARIIREQPERRETEYRNWRRFGAESLLQFEDREEGPAR